MKKYLAVNPELSLSQWRFLRDQAIYYLAVDCDLAPHEIERITMIDVYFNPNGGAPRNRLFREKRTVFLSSRLRETLRILYPAPNLITMREFTQKVAAKKPYGKTLTRGSISDIIQEMHRYEMMKTMEAAAVERAKMADESTWKGVCNA